ncbi:MAG: hypothetical protein WBC70_06450 [Candidatus Aminicenantales bacterium]
MKNLNSAPFSPGKSGIRLKRSLVLFGLVIATIAPASALTFGYKGLISFWLFDNFERASDTRLGGRFIPEFSLSQRISGSFSLDAELSLNGYGIAEFRPGQDIQTEGEVKPYRFWLRLSTSRFEARLGLQKINFGSASLLRALMWFDSLDPRDPLQLTDGVYALLVRYYFQNNANIWVWGLYGNESPKGWESVATAKDAAEYGGRLQLPLLTGELAVTYHHRRFDLIPVPEAPIALPGERVPESRIGLDGKWDLGIGLWFEGTLTHQESDFLPQPWQRAYAFGADYTLGLANGLNIMAEHLRMDRSEKAFRQGEGVDFTALFLRYPVSVFVDLTAIFYYDWKEKEFYRFLSWQRTYDRWRFNIIAFWNPDAFLIYPTQAGTNPFSGKGIQLMVVFNY